jgi:hypothetical protein
MLADNAGLRNGVFLIFTLQFAPKETQNTEFALIKRKDFPFQRKLSSVNFSPGLKDPALPLFSFAFL